MNNKHIITIGLFLALVFGAKAQLPTNGLIACYTFEGNANDVSGNGNHATPAGNYQFLINGLSGGALRAIGDGSQFYAGGGHVLLPTFTSSLNSGFTLSLWVKDEVKGNPPASDVERYINFGASDLTSLGITLHSEAVIWAMNDYRTDTWAESRMPVDMPTYCASGWKHLVLSYAPGKFANFFNGQKLFETNATVNVFPVAQAALNRHWWNNGASSSARMSATYDNVRIYNRALSDAEVGLLYSEEKPFCVPRPATAIAQVVNGFVVGATITDGGCGYTNPPLVMIEGGGGLGALASAVVSNGVVVAININNAGFGYFETPQIIIEPPPTPPVITQSPSPQTVLVGSNAVFNVVSGGSPPLSYQWLKGSVPLADATNASLLLTNCQLPDTGLYSVVVTNLYGSVTASAKLWVTTNTFDLGMVAYYPFSGDARDESGNGNHAVSTGAVLSTNRFWIPSDSYSLVNGYIHTTSSAGFPASMDDFTLSLWLKFTAPFSATSMIFANGAINQFQLALNHTDPSNGFLDFWTGGDHGEPKPDCRTTTLPWVIHQWYNLVVHRSQGVITIYRNGVIVGQHQTTYGNNATPEARNLDFGYRSGPGGYACCQITAQLDDVRIYNRALTAQEIQHLYASEFPDADKDGLNDLEEQNVYHTDPNNRDTDSDGLPDWDEVMVRLTDPTKPDTDGDGYNDYAEIYAGKNPNDINDHPAASLSAFTAIELEFITQTGKTYKIQSSTNLSDWADFDGPITGDGNIWAKLYSIRAQGVRTFYRVELVP